MIAPCATVSKEMIDMLCTDDMKKQLLLQAAASPRSTRPTAS